MHANANHVEPIRTGRWSVDPGDRHARRAYEAIVERTDDLALIDTLEMGKPLAESKAGVAYAATFFRWFSDWPPYVYTRDLNRALRIQEGLPSGMVGLNSGLVSNPKAPLGGVKQSGYGREGGCEGIDTYTGTKHVVLAP